MTQRSPDEVRSAVREHYGQVAKTNGAVGCAPNCCSPTTGASLGLGYSAADLASVPEGADMGLGCGNPQAIASLREGEAVLDLGSGGGFDAFLAAKQVGVKGHVIGVDMTADMVTKARANAKTLGADNVEFRLGEIEHLPVADGTVDAKLRDQPLTGQGRGVPRSASGAQGGRTPRDQRRRDHEGPASGDERTNPRVGRLRVRCGAHRDHRGAPSRRRLHRHPRDAAPREPRVHPRMDAGQWRRGPRDLGDDRGAKAGRREGLLRADVLPAGSLGVITTDTRPALRDLEARLRPFVARRVSSSADVDDVVQDVFLRMQRGLSSLRDEERFGPWVYQVARSAIAEHRRTRTRHPIVGQEQGDAAEAAASTDVDDDGAVERNLATYVAPFIGMLPSPYREALTLTELEGVSQKDAAQMIGISASGMKSRVQRGREKLRALLEDCCEIALDARGRVIGCEPRTEGIRLIQGCRCDRDGGR